MRLHVDISEAFKIAMGALLANKARGLLTALGIIIGIIAVITTMTAANGLQNTFRETFSAVGSDVIYIARRPWVQMGPNFALQKRPPISLEISEALAKRLAGRAVVNASLGSEKNIKFESKTMDDVRIVGSSDKQMLVTNIAPSHGRFLMPNDVQYRKNVAVIGHDIAEGLFGSVDPIGKRVIINRAFFRVIGVLEKQGSTFFGGPNLDRQIFVPISSYLKVIGAEGGPGNINVNIAVKVPAAESMQDFELEVIGEMRRLRGLKPMQDDDFSINKLDSLMGAYNSVMGVVVAVGLAITSISLFVGGVGVMNIMFVSVTERTKEIGIRKAIGARRRSILLQFLFESAVICLAGGLVGIGVASLLTLLINAVLMPASISPAIIITALIISLIVGVVAGLVPAWRASKLDPIEALRYE